MRGQLLIATLATMITSHQASPEIRSVSSPVLAFALPVHSFQHSQP